MSDHMLDPGPGGPWDDPFVAEVRRTREAIWAEVGEDFDRLFERVLKVEAAERAAGREFIDVAARGQHSNAAA